MPANPRSSNDSRRRACDGARSLLSPPRTWKGEEAGKARGGGRRGTPVGPVAVRGLGLVVTRVAAALGIPPMRLVEVWPVGGSSYRSAASKLTRSPRGHRNGSRDATCPGISGGLSMPSLPLALGNGAGDAGEVGGGGLEGVVHALVVNPTVQGGQTIPEARHTVPCVR